MSSKLYKLIPFIIDVNNNKIGILGYLDENGDKTIFLNYNEEVLLLKEKGNWVQILHPDGIVWVEINDIYGPLDINKLLENLSIIESERK